jgi:hypothetical protein
MEQLCTLLSTFGKGHGDVRRDKVRFYYELGGEFSGIGHDRQPFPA